MIVSKKTHVHVIFDSFFPVRFVAKRHILQQKKQHYIYLSQTVSEGTNRNLPARNILVKLLALYTNPESHNAHRYRQTDGQTT